MLLLLIDTALVLVAGFQVYRAMEQRTRPALGLVGVGILASVVPFYIAAGDGAIIRFAAAAIAASMALRDRGWSPEALPQVFPGIKKRAQVAPVSVGLLAGLVAAGHPAYLPLSVGLVLMLSGGLRRLMAAGGMIVGMLATSLPPPLGGGWSGTLSSLSWPMGRASLWAGFEFGFGRSFGIVPYFLPLVLLLALHKFRGSGKMVVWGSVISIVTLCVLWPFDWLAAPDLPGNGWFLPLYGALLIVPSRPAFRWSLLLVAGLAASLLLPHWWGRLPGLTAPDVRRPTAASQWLPVEISPRSLVTVRLAVGSMEVWSPDLAPDRGAWKIPGREWGSLVVSSEVPLDRLWLDCGGQAGSEIEVRGGDSGDTLFRADGGVAFAIDLPAGRRQQVSWHHAPIQLYVLRFRLPRAPAAPIRVRVLQQI